MEDRPVRPATMKARLYCTDDDNTVIPVEVLTWQWEKSEEAVEILVPNSHLMALNLHSGLCVRVAGETSSLRLAGELKIRRLQGSAEGLWILLAVNRPWKVTP